MGGNNGLGADDRPLSEAGKRKIQYRLKEYSSGKTPASEEQTEESSAE